MMGKSWKIATAVKMLQEGKSRPEVCAELEIGKKTLEMYLWQARKDGMDVPELVPVKWQAIKMLQAGRTRKEVCEALMLPPKRLNTYVYQARMAGAVVPGRAPHYAGTGKLSPGAEEALRLHKRGLKNEEVCRVLGISMQGLYNRIRTVRAAGIDWPYEVPQIANARQRQQLCWDCKNTSGDKCSWFTKAGTPVPGWDARPAKLTHCGKYTCETFEIRHCPNFDPEPGTDRRIVQENEDYYRRTGA